MGEMYMNEQKIIQLKEHIKAVFFDIDGTYYDQITHRIPDSNIQAVKALQQQGYKVALASARAACFKRYKLGWNRIRWWSRGL